MLFLGAESVDGLVDGVEVELAAAAQRDTSRSKRMTDRKRANPKNAKSGIVTTRPENSPKKSVSW
jgi:hypothetical protein